MFVKRDLYPSLTVGTLLFPELDCCINGWTFVFFALHQRRNGNRTQNIHIFLFFWWLVDFQAWDNRGLQRKNVRICWVEGENELNFFAVFSGLAFVKCKVSNIISLPPHQYKPYFDQTFRIFAIWASYGGY